MVDRIFRGDLRGHAFDVGLGDRKRHIGLASGVRKIRHARFGLPSSFWIERDPHVGPHSRRNDAGDRELEMVWHHAGDRIAAPVEREGPADDGGVGSQPPPERSGNHDARLILEPLAQNWIHAELAGQRRRDRNTLDVMRLTREDQVLAGVAEPSERIEDAGPLLIRLCVLERERPVVHGIVDLCAEDDDEPVAVTIRQWFQHHRVDDGVDRCGGSDARCEGSRREERDRLGVPPRSPRLQNEHAGIMQRRMAEA